MQILVQGFALIALVFFSIPSFGGEPAGEPAGEPTHDPAILEQVVAAQQQHTTVQGKLRWLTRQIADPTAPVREQQVQFYLAFPQRYHVIVTKAEDQELKQHFISDGKTRREITEYGQGEKPDVKTAPIGGDDEFERRLMACFRFDRATLQGDFSILAIATADMGAEIRLTPSAVKLKEQLSMLVLTFDAKRALVAIRSDDPQGNRLDFIVQEATYDQVLDDALFHVAPGQEKP
jgi:hypothetical protein